MESSKLQPNDPRVRRDSVVVRDKTYEYILGEPETGPPRATILLLHGFPDLAFGWRCQVPFLMSLGFRVIAPDMLGYGGTDAPQELQAYSFKNIGTDMRELVQSVAGNEKIILGGHDWGGFAVWRIAMRYPDWVKAAFSIIAPFALPGPEYVSVKEIVATKFPQFYYRLQFREPDLQEAIQSAQKLRQFLRVIYCAGGPEGTSLASPESGVKLAELHLAIRPEQLNEEEENYCTQQYMRQQAPQLRGPCNWYRTDRINWEDDQELIRNHVRLEMPTLYIGASYDPVLTPAMSRGMEDVATNLTRGEVKAWHWAHIEKSAEVNACIGDWLSAVVKKGAQPCS